MITLKQFNMACNVRTRICGWLWTETKRRKIFRKCGSINLYLEKRLEIREFGQAAPHTHPHLFNQGEVTPGITKDEYFKRRHILMEEIAKSDLGKKHNNHIIIIPSSTRLFMSHDVPYPFRQNTDFSYICGFLEPDSVLILHNVNETSLSEYKSVLFVPKRDPKKELWEGKRSGIEGAIELTGVDNAYNTEDLEGYLQLYLKQTSDFAILYQYNQPPHLEYHFKCIHPFINEGRHSAIDSPIRVFHKTRLFKSAAEIKLMRKTCQIAGDAFKSVMKFSHGGIEESHLYAKMDFECRIKGAKQLAYPPVVAGGDRANVIHYIRNDQRVEREQMVLMDAGCDYHGYSSDITRTWPVSGRFTEAQHDIYTAVLRVQQACVEYCKKDQVSLDDIYRYMLELQGEELKKLNIISNKLQGLDILQAAKEFCPHHVGHYLGMDVHDCDTVSRNTKLQPGMIVTIEPGLYFPSSRKDIPSDYRGIGVRIEDDVLITNNGYENLTSSSPKSISDIEQVMNK